MGKKKSENKEIVKITPKPNGEIKVEQKTGDKVKVEPKSATKLNTPTSTKKPDQTLTKPVNGINSSPTSSVSPGLKKKIKKMLKMLK